MKYYCSHCQHQFEIADGKGRIIETCEICGLEAVRID